MHRRQVRQVGHAFPGQRPLIPVGGGRRSQRQPVPRDRESALLIGPGGGRAERTECLMRHDAAGFVHRERSPVRVVRAHRGERFLRRRLRARERRPLQPRNRHPHVASRVVHDVAEAATTIRVGAARNGLARRIASFLADQSPDSGEAIVRRTNDRGGLPTIVSALRRRCTCRDECANADEERQDEALRSRCARRATDSSDMTLIRSSVFCRVSTPLTCTLCPA